MSTECHMSRVSRVRMICRLGSRDERSQPPPLKPIRPLGSVTSDPTEHCDRRHISQPRDRRESLTHGAWAPEPNGKMRFHFFSYILRLSCSREALANVECSAFSNQNPPNLCARSEDTWDTAKLSEWQAGLLLQLSA